MGLASACLGPAGAGDVRSRGLAEPSREGLRGSKLLPQVTAPRGQGGAQHSLCRLTHSVF